jgi:hypothetical protein
MRRLLLALIRVAKVSTLLPAERTSAWLDVSIQDLIL